MAIDLKGNNCFEYEEKKHSTISASFANKTRYEFDNSNKKYIFSKRQLDNCLIRNETACDWLFIVDKNGEKGKENNHLIFVELKDSDLINAIEQIKKTIQKLGISNNENTVHARIVLTKAYSLDIKDIRTQKFIREIKLAGGTVDYKSQKLIESKID